jgi:hypothetical protein
VACTHVNDTGRTSASQHCKRAPITPSSSTNETQPTTDQAKRITHAVGVMRRKVPGAVSAHAVACTHELRGKTNRGYKPKAAEGRGEWDRLSGDAHRTRKGYRWPSRRTRAHGAEQGPKHQYQPYTRLKKRQSIAVSSYRRSSGGPDRPRAIAAAPLSPAESGYQHTNGATVRESRQTKFEV